MVAANAEHLLLQLVLVHPVEVMQLGLRAPAQVEAAEHVGLCTVDDLGHLVPVIDLLERHGLDRVLGREVGTVEGAALEVLETGAGDLDADLDAVFSTTGSQNPADIAAAGQAGLGAPPKDEDDLLVELIDE